MTGHIHLSLSPAAGEKPDPAKHLTVRFGWNRDRIMRMVADGTFPPPMNREQRRDLRWSIEVVRSYELGDWSPGPILRAVS